jgi:hypothetical protein
VSALPYQQFLLQHSVRVDCRVSRCGDPVAASYPRRRAVTSVDTPGSRVLNQRFRRHWFRYGSRFEAVRHGEIQRLRARLGSLSLDQENDIDSLTHALIERMLQAPMAMLENPCGGNQAVFVLAMVRRRFNLRT